MTPDLQGTWKITAQFNVTSNMQAFSLEFKPQQNGNDPYAGAYLYYHGKSTGAPGGTESSYLLQAFSSEEGTVISMIEHNGPYSATYCGHFDPSISTITGSWVDIRGNSGTFSLEK